MKSFSIPTWQMDPKHHESRRQKISSPNKCYYVILEPGTIKNTNLIREVIKDLTKKITSAPKVVIAFFDTKAEEANFSLPLPISSPWISVSGRHEKCRRYLNFSCVCKIHCDLRIFSAEFVAFSPANLCCPKSYLRKVFDIFHVWRQVM